MTRKKGLILLAGAWVLWDQTVDTDRKFVMDWRAVTGLPTYEQCIKERNEMEELANAQAKLTRANFNALSVFSRYYRSACAQRNEGQEISAAFAQHSPKRRCFREKRT